MSAQDFDKNKLWEFAQNIGTKKENFDYGLANNPAYAKQLIETAKFMGWIK